MSNKQHDDRADDSTDQDERADLRRRIEAIEEKISTGETFAVSRRQALGLLGGSTLLGAAGTVSAQSNDDDPPWSPDNHDHSGEHGTATQLGKAAPVESIRTEQLQTQQLSNIKVVGPDGYDSIQAAHDDLPDKGGQIKLTKNITETDIVFTKRTKLVGGGAGLAAGRHPKIDTSGGNGLHLKTADCTVRDLQIVGDKSGGYGLKLGVKEEFRGRYTVDNVAIHNKGSHGVLIVGAHLNDRLDINARNCAGNGWHWDHDWFNENLIHRLGANRCDGKGVHIEGNAFIGNTVNMLWCEDNTDWGMYVADGTNFAGNVFTGYGIEEGEGAPTLYMPKIDGTGGNVFHVAVINNGEIQLDESDFGSLIVGRTQETLWRNDSPVKPGKESSHFTVTHTPGDTALEIRSDTDGLIGTIDKQGTARFTGDVISNAPSLYEPYEVPKQSLTIDGDLADVSGTDGLSLTKDFSVYDGTYTNDGTVWWRWDQEHLYIAADLVDDSHVQDESAGKMWRDDCIQFGVSSGKLGDAATWDGGDIALGPDDPVVYHRVFPEGSNTGVLDGPAAIVREGNHTRYEVGLPWSVLTANPSDEFVSLALAVHDRDGGNTNTGWLEWGGGILGGKNNNEFNLASLVSTSSN